MATVVEMEPEVIEGTVPPAPVMTFEPATILGKTPMAKARPWLIAGGVLLALWWVSRH